MADDTDDLEFDSGEEFPVDDIDRILLCAANRAYEIESDGAELPLSDNPAYNRYNIKNTKCFLSERKINAAFVGQTEEATIIAFRGTLPFGPKVISALPSYVAGLGLKGLAFLVPADSKLGEVIKTATEATELFVLKEDSAPAHNFFTDWQDDVMGAHLSHDSNQGAVPIVAQLKGRTHRKFREGIRELWDGSELKPYLLSLLRQPHVKAANRIWLTGHSKGGALAVLCAYLCCEELRREFPELHIQVRTFAAPRVGDKVFVEHYDSLDIQTKRFEYGGDIVPHMPPEATMFGALQGVLALLGFEVKAIAGVKGYRPVGDLRYIRFKGTKIVGNLSTLEEASQDVTSLANLLASIREGYKGLGACHNSHDDGSYWKAIFKETVGAPPPGVALLPPALEPVADRIHAKITIIEEIEVDCVLHVPRPPKKRGILAWMKRASRR